MEISSPNISQVMQQESAAGGQSASGAGSSTNGPISMAAAFAAAIEAEKPPSWQLDLMMEKLRQKSNQLKPLGETSKNIRMALQERRYFLDQGDRQHLQKCLDTLQQSIKVSSLQSMVERLEMVSRQLGLKFTPGATGNEWFISSDMFYLELLIDQSGMVQEVKIQHDGKTEQQSVPEMVSCLRKNDFADFTAHLEGLVAIYQLNADKKIKSKAFIALQALESDLLLMASTYSHVKDGEAIVMKSLLGLVLPRKGGHPVKLTYFISPYEFLDVNSKITLPSDVDTIVEKKLGNVATICIQGSVSRKLQMSTTVSIMRGPDGKNHPRYGTLNATNSTALPACFTVNLGKPIPICKELLQIIQNTTGIHCFDFSNPQPILSLVTRHYSGGTLDCTNNRGLFVALPDTPNTLQVHCYFMTETPNLEGILVSSINFTLASQLPQVVSILRQQLIFNTLVGSCVRVGSKPDMDCMVFEVNALSHQNVSVSFQHPLEDSLVTLEFDLRDVSHPMCRLHAVTNAADIIPTLEEHACKVVQRSLSIPITVRAVIRRWQTMKSKFEPPNPEFNIPVGGAFGSESMNQLQSNEISCAAESERAHNQQQSSQQNSMVPGVVMGLSGNVDNSSNMNNNVSSIHSSPMSSGRHPSGNSSYTISPVQQSGGASTLSNFTSPSAQQNHQNQQQNPMDLLSSYMNPLFLSNQLGNLSGAIPGNFPNLSGLTLQNLQNLSGLLDQVGQRGRRRKRKGTSSDSTPIPPLSGGGMTVQGNPNVPRPSPSPSPKSPRQIFPNKSPKRRPSEGSDISDTSQGDSRAATPQTPLTPHGNSNSGNSNSALNLFMTEMGLEMPDPRWNIDITPVGGTTGNSNQNVAQAMENFLASKLLSGFGSAAAAAAANANQSQSSGSDFHMELDSDLEADGNNDLNKFPVPQNKKVKKPRDFPKRSISLDSGHSGGSADDNISSNLQSFLNSASSSTSADGTDFKPLVTPSLSITPVPTNATSSQSAVNSLLANMRTGIEIIPLPNPVQIPNSITVTPINPKALGASSDKDGNSGKKSAASIIKDGKKDETSNPEGTTTIKKKLGPVSDANNKKDRKRKASNMVPPLLDEEGLPVHDFSSKQPKLLPYGNMSSTVGTSITSVTDKKSGMSVSLKNSSPPFGLSMKKPGSPSLNRAPTLSKGSSPTPKIGGKPSVSTLKSVSGSPKYPDISLQSSTKKANKERKGNNNSSSFQGNSKIAKNLSMVGNPNAVANLMPTLKSLNDGSLPLSLASLNPGLLNVPNSSALKTEANMAEALIKANLLTKSVMDATKAQMQGNSSAATQLAQATAAAVAAQIQRSNSTSGSTNNNSGSSGAPVPAGKKSGNLLAVIDKLRSSQVSGEDSTKKELSKVDYLKASSGMTSDVMQLKKSQGASSGASGGSVSAESVVTGSNSQYVVKPGQPGGLKMTLGKTKSAPSLGGSKDKTKSGMKSSGSKKSSFSGLKPPSLSNSTTASTGSSISKPVPSLSSIGSMPKKTSSSGNSNSSGSSSSSKDKEKDSTSKSQKTSNGNSSSSSRKTAGVEDEVDLARKLFMPGGLDAPKFDITKYQIPKKSSSSSSSGLTSTPAGSSSGLSESSPKNMAQSPSSTPTKPEKEVTKEEKDTKGPIEAFKEKSEASSLQSSAVTEMTTLSSTSTAVSTVLLSSTVEKVSPAPGAASTNEPTKIKLSSASIGSSENFIEEMTKLFPNKGNFAAGSPMNLSGCSVAASSKSGNAPAPVPSEPLISVGEPDSTTSETPSAPLQAPTKEDSKREDNVAKSSPPAQPSAAAALAPAETFTSPESPEPCVPEDVNKSTLTIPTTPQAQATTSPPTEEISSNLTPAVATSAKQPSPLPSPGDEDQLVIDVDKKTAEALSTRNSSNPAPGKDESLKSSSNSSGSTSDCMPPPPLPDSAAGFIPSTSSTPVSSSASVGSPSPSSSPAPPPPPPTATVPIVSVHIVHSPQPNSPALLRSPLVVQSPHSSHASPYPIDDDLMDEALIGTGK